MKHFNIKGYLVLLIVFLGLALPSTAQSLLDLPAGSQKATVSQRVGITDITIDYSRPSVRDREIWGVLVPYGMNNLGFGTATVSPWRAGANENTTIEFTDDVSIEGKPLKAGKYGLHMVLEENGEATVIFSKDATSWGSFFYDEKKDALRVTVKSEEASHTELLTYQFTEVTPNSATASLLWEKKAIPFKIEVDVTNIVLTDIRKKLNSSPGFSRQSWEQAARFALNNGGDLEEALQWINNTISGQFYSQKTFTNLQIKSQILAKMGKNAEAAATMEEATDLGSSIELYQYGRLLMRQNDNDKALTIFKKNEKIHGSNTWPVSLGIARAYSAAGKYKTALKYLEKALKNAPDKPNKDAILARMEKLKKGEDFN
ncbi:DUF2911 domain-containing protein [Leptobacterium sp. I13]|uniref:DUF2911 domain-containing protein n=1 Tax=Leptobacterium meishanense TaxID=3128904 RepID=UPI0030EEF882